MLICEWLTYGMGSLFIPVFHSIIIEVHTYSLNTYLSMAAIVRTGYK